MPDRDTRTAPRPLNRLLASGRPGALTRRALELARMAQALWPELGAELAAHCALVRLDRDALVLAADSPAWATRLRLEAPRLLAAAAAASPQAAPTRLVVRIAPTLAGGAPAPTPPPRQATIGPRATALLEKLSESTADPALRSIWARLARRGSRR